MQPIRRRRFLSKLAGGAGALQALGAPSLLTAGKPPSERVNVAVIGINGMGGYHLRGLLQRDDVQVSALCDVDERVLAKRSKEVETATGKQPKLSIDFQRVLDTNAIDAVIVATPHHWHCPIAIRALQAGKDVYIEKPASHVFREGRALERAALQYKRVVQHGTQMRSSPVTAAAGEVLASGLIGEVKTTKAWNVQRLSGIPPIPDEPVPDGVDYERWLGPAPRRPFNSNRFHKNWRSYRDYGNGDIGDDGIHDIDMARWALGVDTHPVRVTAHGSTVDLEGEREYPDNMMVTCQYADGKVFIYEDRLWTPYGMHGVDSGNAFYGTEGYMIFSRRGYFQTYLGRKEEKGPGMGRKDTGVASPGRLHMGNFLDCVRSRETTIASPHEAHLSCGLVHLGETAFRTGRVLQFDPASESFPNDSEANALLTKEYRQPWRLPDVS